MISDPKTTPDSEDVPEIYLDHLDQLWFQVAGTRCNLSCHHCFISCHPKNFSFGFLKLQTVKERLEESAALGVKEYYFTGGEPFLNPDMTDILVTTLKYGPATVLTNGTVIKEEWLERLRDAEQESTFGLEFRVSIDGVTSEQNDPIRGEGSFDRAMKGVSKLVEFGFMPIITSVRTWDMADDFAIIKKFKELLGNVGYKRPRLKILPPLQMGAEADRTRGYSVTERVTQAMMDGYDHSQLVCSYSRIVTDRGVHVCPILIESPDSKMGETLQDSMKPFAMKHGACMTCYQYGAICSNATGSSRESKQEKLPILPNIVTDE